MAFVNLYALLGVEPTATETEIVKAMRQMAQLQLISLDDLKLCKNTLLDPEARKNIMRSYLLNALRCWRN
ncbi:hypothetical protein CPT77_02850 [Snodgrassella alvi]|uniref:hypothetical protein n=1 Tax=Snodgrassella alvi TaxID=1196083 RepID=UPI000BBD5C54|nr:hypothetical protein [Snodgrassella alvi]PCL21293.1 hypothetical protein CPT77_02850 [Snodgrassella alvi]